MRAADGIGGRIDLFCRDPVYRELAAAVVAAQLQRPRTAHISEIAETYDIREVWEIPDMY